MKRFGFVLIGLLISTVQAEPDSTEGKRLYFESGGYGCVVCHGLVAEGGGQAGGFIRGAALDTLNSSLAENEPMKPLASVLTAENRADIIAYLQSLSLIPLVQLRYENNQWTALAEPLQIGQVAELIAYNATFETQSLDLTMLGLGIVQLPALGSESYRWVAKDSEFDLPTVVTSYVESFADVALKKTQ